MDQPTNAAPAASQEGLVEINDLDSFVQALTGWYTNKVAILAHMKAIPDGNTVQLGDDAPVTLTGDLLKGFQIGLGLALSEIGVLPFTPEFEDEAPASVN